MKVEYYDMLNDQRGSAAIFTDSSVTNNCNNKCVEKLLMALKKLGFSISQHIDKNVHEIKSILKSIADLDHENADCIMVFVVTEANPDEELYSYLYEPLLNSRSLVNKPKMIFVQAQENLIEMDGLSDRIICSYTHREVQVPRMADMLIVKSSFPAEEFLAGFSAEIHQYRQRVQHQDILTRIMLLNQHLLAKYEMTPYDRKPSIITISTLTKKLVLKFKSTECTSIASINT